LALVAPGVHLVQTERVAVQQFFLRCHFQQAVEGVGKAQPGPGLEQVVGVEAVYLPQPQAGTHATRTTVRPKHLAVSLVGLLEQTLTTALLLAGVVRVAAVPRQPLRVLLVEVRSEGALAAAQGALKEPLRVAMEDHKHLEAHLEAAALAVLLVARGLRAATSKEAAAEVESPVQRLAMVAQAGVQAAVVVAALILQELLALAAQVATALHASHLGKEQHT